jgi:hypothetical protein
MAVPYRHRLRAREWLWLAESLVAQAIWLVGKKAVVLEEAFGVLGLAAPRSSGRVVWR